MAYKVLLTPAAEEDLQHIVAYLDKHFESPAAVQNFLDAFDRCRIQMESYPYSFETSRAPELKAKGYRKFLVGNYVGLYLVQPEKELIYIARIFHGSQNYPKYL